jgi:hypothetical protein
MNANALIISLVVYWGSHDTNFTNPHELTQPIDSVVKKFVTIRVIRVSKSSVALKFFGNFSPNFRERDSEQQKLKTKNQNQKE